MGHYQGSMGKRIFKIFFIRFSGNEEEYIDKGEKGIEKYI